jgi:hypothetical protein
MNEDTASRARETFGKIWRQARRSARGFRRGLRRLLKMGAI